MGSFKTDRRSDGSKNFRARVELRNQVAKTLGYPDYFQMQLDLQEVDAKWLQTTLDDLAERSDHVYTEMLNTIFQEQAKRFNVSKEELGPWAWGDPFCQEDPLNNQELRLVG